MEQTVQAGSSGKVGRWLGDLSTPFAESPNQPAKTDSSPGVHRNRGVPIDPDQSHRCRPTAVPQDGVESTGNGPN
jgi:hypothetical protein